MAGVGGDKVVDPAAMWQREPERVKRARRRKADVPTEPPVSLEVAPELPMNLACLVCRCPMPAGARFCPSCGQPVQAAAAAAPVPDGRPKPAELLTPAERAERDRQHAAALAAGARDPGVRYAPPQPGQRTVMIHILVDGFTAFGQVWFRGQELEVAVGGPRWADASRWIEMDDFGQMALYKKVYFRAGPWPGARSYTAAAGRFAPLKSLSDDSQLVYQLTAEELAQADQLEQRRGRGVPMPMIG